MMKSEIEQTISLMLTPSAIVFYDPSPAIIYEKNELLQRNQSNSNHTTDNVVV